MQEFLLILRGDGMNHLSPNELQSVMSEYQNWVKTLGEKYIGGQRLEERGSFLEDKTSKVITDGPFLEAKEIIAGFFILGAESQIEADQLTRTCPLLGLYSMEIRPIQFPKMS